MSKTKVRTSDNRLGYSIWFLDRQETDDMEIHYMAVSAGDLVLLRNQIDEVLKAV